MCVAHSQPATDCLGGLLLSAAAREIGGKHQPRTIIIIIISGMDGTEEVVATAT